MATTSEKAATMQTSKLFVDGDMRAVYETQSDTKSDTGPFSLIPEWVLDLPISDRAVRLYGMLARYADDVGQAWPSRRTLWTRLRCSERSLDSAVKELEAHGALTHERRQGSSGAPTSNLWTLCRVWGGAKMATTWGKDSGEGGAGIAARTRTNERESLKGANGASAVPDSRVQELVAGYVEDYQSEREGHPPPPRWRGAAGRAAKEALASGESVKDIAGCFYVIAHEGKNPNTLNYVLADSHAGRERRIK